jgi:hypothetical protein
MIDYILCRVVCVLFGDANGGNVLESARAWLKQDALSGSESV